MSAASTFRAVGLRAFNGSYLARLPGVKNNCELCNCKTVTRSFNTRSERYAFRFCHRFMSRVRVRHLHSSCFLVTLYLGYCVHFVYFVYL